MPDLVTRALEIVLVQSQQHIATLVPIGQQVSGWLVVLSIMLLGVSLGTGQAAYVGPIVRMCGASAGTLWGIATWPTIVADTFHASQAVIGMITGTDGMLGLYTLGADVAARILAQGASVSLMHPVDSVAQAVAAGLAAFLVILGMAVAGILVLLAEIELMIGAVLAPLLLPGLAFGLTAQIGWGAVYFLVRGSVRVMATAAGAAVMARAVATVVAFPGTDQPLTLTETGELVTLSLATAVLCFSAKRLADSLVGQAGVLGLSSVGRVAGLSQTVGVAATGAAMTAASAAVKGGAAAASGVAAAAEAKGGRGAAASGALARTSGSGSPFAA